MRVGTWHSGGCPRRRPLTDPGRRLPPSPRKVSSHEGPSPAARHRHRPHLRALRVAVGGGRRRRGGGRRGRRGARLLGRQAVPPDGRRRLLPERRAVQVRHRPELLQMEVGRYRHGRLSHRAERARPALPAGPRDRGEWTSGSPSAKRACERTTAHESVATRRASTGVDAAPRGCEITTDVCARAARVCASGSRGAFFFTSSPRARLLFTLSSLAFCVCCATAIAARELDGGEGGRIDVAASVCLRAADRQRLLDEIRARAGQPLVAELAFASADGVWCYERPRPDKTSGNYIGVALDAFLQLAEVGPYRCRAPLIVLSLGSSNERVRAGDGSALSLSVLRPLPSLPLEMTGHSPRAAARAPPTPLRRSRSTSCSTDCLAARATRGPSNATITANEWSRTWSPRPRDEAMGNGGRARVRAWTKQPPRAADAPPLAIGHRPSAPLLLCCALRVERGGWHCAWSHAKECWCVPWVVRLMRLLAVFLGAGFGRLERPCLRVARGVCCGLTAHRIAEHMAIRLALERGPSRAPLGTYPTTPPEVSPCFGRVFA